MLQSWNKQICEVRNDVGSSGQFYHGIEYEVSNLRPGEVPEKPDATMYVKGQELTVTRYTWDGLIVCSSLAFGSPNIYHGLHRGWQRDFRKDIKNGENVPCWFIHHNGTGLIDGDATDYIVSSLF